VKGGAAFPVRLEYTKRGKVRWISHRDVARALERAFRITELPLAFTAGFSPRPKVSFGLALSTGHESDTEYLDLEFSREVDLDSLPALVTAALPEGLEITAAVPLEERAPALQEIVTAVTWRVEVTRGDGTPIPEAELRSTLDAGLAAATLPTTRRRKGREVTEDVRPVIRRIEIIDEPGAIHPVVEMELQTQPRGAKPGEVLAAIATATGATHGLTEARALRTNQWIERDGARCEPLDADTRPRAEVRAS
jgi:radical SAM-linked protein